MKSANFLLICKYLFFLNSKLYWIFENHLLTFLLIYRNSLYNNNQEQQWKKEYNIIEKKDANKLDVFEDEYEDDSSSTEDYENITITLSEEDLADRIDDALMCSLLGRCFEDQQ